MNISRLATLSLTMAIAVFALGYNPSFADKPICGDNNDQHCDHGDDPGFPTGITVQLIGGAFVSVDDVGIPTPVGVTAEAEVKLSGDEPIRMIRPGADPALLSWNMVFDLCGLLGPPGSPEVLEFTVPAGRKGWAIEKVVDEVWVGLGFTLDSPLDPSDPLFTESLSAGMQLKGACLDPECGLIPAVNTSKTIPLTDYAIHLRAKGGVTHQALCHAGDGPIGVTTNLVITAP